MKQYNVFLILIYAIILFGCKQNDPGGNRIVDNELSNEDKLQVEFASLDSLIISANIYEISKDSPVILLCHQARFNKFEYEGIAQELNRMGYNCIAIDQRSGGPIANMVNNTYNRAVKLGKETNYIDAEQDIIAAINYSAERYEKPIILWGSSYSSTLALYLASENEKVMAVVSFSPGNYLSEYKGSSMDKLVGFEKPMFVTSSKREAEGVTELFKYVKLNENQIIFVPEGGGHHGSRALWKSQQGGDEYWAAVGSFLVSIKK